VTRKKVAGFEEKNRVIPINQILVHKVVNAPTGNAALELLKRARLWGKRNNYEEMQIRFRGDDRRSASPRFATDLADAEDAVYSRLEPLTGFKEPLEQCPKESVVAWGKANLNGNRVVALHLQSADRGRSGRSVRAVERHSVSGNRL
jgi:hypothetical protein